MCVFKISTDKLSLSSTVEQKTQSIVIPKKSIPKNSQVGSFLKIGVKIPISQATETIWRIPITDSKM